jgi:hypothetical protein
MTCRFADININLRTEPSGISDMRRINTKREREKKNYILFFINYHMITQCER